MHGLIALCFSWTHIFWQISTTPPWVGLPQKMLFFYRNGAPVLLLNACFPKNTKLKKACQKRPYKSSVALMTRSIWNHVFCIVLCFFMKINRFWSHLASKTLFFMFLKKLFRCTCSLYLAYLKNIFCWNWWFTRNSGV